MYETEVYINKIKEDLPQHVLNEFIKTYDDIKLMSSLHWTEHCVECSMPSCFSTCDLYQPRVDGKCQRFVEGIEKIELAPEITVKQPLLKISFKKWGVLATQANSELYSKREVQNLLNKDYKLSKTIHLSPSKFLKKKLIQKRYSVKKNAIIDNQNKGTQTPDGFLAEIFNPHDDIIKLGLVIRNDDVKYSKIPFQYTLELKPGYNKELVPFTEIAKRIKSNLAYRINLIPENVNRSKPLYFGITEFVKLNSRAVSNTKADKVKCVVWDLDNTVWEGTLVENGKENLKLKEGIVDILTQLEERGVINSISSKNNYDMAMEALDYFKLKDFFIYPKISWLPKSKSIREIATDLNINVNSLLFIDDSIFERKEVEAVLPQVRLVDAIHYKDLLGLEALKIEVTKEGKKRKTFYVNEEKRKTVSNSFEGEYFDFLKSCKIDLEIVELQDVHFDRVYELTQRTNQMNFSGNRYNKDDIAKIHQNSDLAAYVLKCSDTFGEYGIIGFGIIEVSKNKLIDLMFSCRIQSKRVEHAFMTNILEHYLKFGDFLVKYKFTEKNKFSAQVFNDFGFETINEENGIKELLFSKEKNIPNDNIINVVKK
ncbi:HAD-IIIC family phosphatase [Seonamhaeicola marinus]|uniref:HAD-IIIC family phosphatase n=1 Tax=Seonamhaeicola marinus TaxID=1912246 RepID=A0A5D0HEM5_9FLAO|nr:HAD-IIIC family phosphatase [Seonamhaeicola marinus]TYA69834.1 HAD-IIIC family phosphatase [Seonamhaeicola marinus]